MVPAGGQALEVKRGRRVLLDGATELDQTVGNERIELLACWAPILVEKIVEDARHVLARAGGDLHRVGTIEPGCDQETLWIEKVKP